MSESQGKSFEWQKIAMLILAAIVGALSGEGIDLITPQPEPLPVVESWYVTSNGEVIESPEVISVANNLKQGSYELVGYPKAGKITRLGVVITADGNPPNPTPKPPEPLPPKPEPPTPPQPQPPKPVLTGFAIDVYEQARALPPADCSRVADSYESVSSQIAAGGILTIDQAENKLFTLNKALQLDPSKWNSFSLWIGSQYEKRATSLKQAGSLMDETARGLRAVGGAK